MLIYTMEKLKMLNVFGITPTNNARSAGMDFYIPSIVKLDAEKRNIAIDALLKSYKITMADWTKVVNGLHKVVAEIELASGANDIEHTQNAFGYIYEQIPDMTMFWFALDSYDLKFAENENDFVFALRTFINQYVTFDEKGKLGFKMSLNDALLINTGIKVALKPGTMGMFDNKSGMGNRGWDVRAKIIDEDYTGYVHMSVAYTKEGDGKQNTIYIGDKLLQLMVVPVIHCDPEEVSEEEYNELMNGSQRGDAGFGSSDVKH